MKFRLFYNKKPKLSVSDIDSFSGKEYVCHFLLQTMSGKPVTISQSALLSGECNTDSPASISAPMPRPWITAVSASAICPASD